MSSLPQLLNNVNTTTSNHLRLAGICLAKASKNRLLGEMLGCINNSEEFCGCSDKKFSGCSLNEAPRLMFSSFFFLQLKKQCCKETLETAL